MRVHDNRVDQPAGRALTITAFGPVSCVHNHFNSERTGPSAGNDLLVGCVYINNIANAQQGLARQSSSLSGWPPHWPPRPIRCCRAAKRWSAETMIRLGRAESIARRRSPSAVSTSTSRRIRPPRSVPATISSTYSSSVTACARRPGATSRRRTRRRSLMSQALLMNMTALNQADHCIVTLPPRGGGQRAADGGVAESDHRRVHVQPLRHARGHRPVSSRRRSPRMPTSSAAGSPRTRSRRTN